MNGWIHKQWIDNEWMNEMNYKYEWIDELINQMHTIALL